MISLTVNLATIFFIAATIWRLTKERRIVLIFVLISLVNPWLYFYSRFLTESAFSLFFVSLAIFFFFGLRKVSYSLPAFVLAFYNYFGTKPSILVLVPALSLLAKKFFKFEKKFNLANYLIFFFALILPFFIFAFLDKSTFQQRKGEIQILDLSYYSNFVDEDRRQSIDVPFKSFFSNKLTFAVLDFSRKYLGWINPSFLFFEGDPSGAHRFSSFAMFYILDIVFLVLGIAAYSFFKTKGYKFFYYLILTFLVIAPLGSALSKGESYIFRSSLIIIPILGLISLGINYFLEFFDKTKKKIAISLLILFYLLFFANFLYSYFIRYPVARQENYFLGERVLSSYIKRIVEKKEGVVVIGKSPRQLYQQYILYTKSLQNLAKFQYPSDYYEIDKVIFTRSCPKLETKKTIVVQSGIDCFKDKGLLIQNQKDSGGLFYIYNDSLCDSKDLDFYRRNHLISDYKIESMEDDQFCNRWIAKL